MQIENRGISPGSGDAYGTLGGRPAVVISGETRDTNAAAPGATGGFDPTSRVSLSVDALLYLSRTRRAPEKYPALTKDEWSNKLSPQLAAREYQAFGKYSETGDYKAYYRAFMDYYDNLRPEDQNSLRYFGTRDAAMVGLRSTEYSGQGGSDDAAVFQTLVSVLLGETRPAGSPTHSDSASGMMTGDMFGWDTGTTNEETVREASAPVSEIEKFYLDIF